MALKIDTKFEGKLTCASKNWHEKNWNLDGILFSEVENVWALKFTGKLYVMTAKNDAKIEEELTCQFKIDMRNLMNFDPSTQRSLKFAL